MMFLRQNLVQRTFRASELLDEHLLPRSRQFLLPRACESADSIGRCRADMRVDDPATGIDRGPAWPRYQDATPRVHSFSVQFHQSLPEGFVGGDERTFH